MSLPGTARAASPHFLGDLPMAEGDRRGAGGLAEGSPVTERPFWSSPSSCSRQGGRLPWLCAALPQCARSAPAEGQDGLGIARRASVRSIKRCSTEPETELQKPLDLSNNTPRLIALRTDSVVSPDRPLASSPNLSSIFHYPGSTGMGCSRVTAVSQPSQERGWCGFFHLFFEQTDVGRVPVAFCPRHNQLPSMKYFQADSWSMSWVGPWSPPELASTAARLSPGASGSTGGRWGGPELNPLLPPACLHGGMHPHSTGAVSIH